MTEAVTENPYPLNLLTDEQRITYNQWLELFEICHNPPPEGKEIGTIIMPTGDWMDRAGPSLNLFKQIAYRQKTLPHLVVTGKHSHPDFPRGGASAEKVIRAMNIFGNISNELKRQLIPEANADNTKLQAENIYSLMVEGKIGEPWIVVVSTYHLPRLYSTFIKIILNKESQIATHLYSIPVDLPWEKDIPHEPRGERWKQIFGEVDRIQMYRELGDAATQEELNYYLKWLETYG